MKVTVEANFTESRIDDRQFEALSSAVPLVKLHLAHQTQDRLPTSDGRTFLYTLNVALCILISASRFDLVRLG